MTSHPKDFSEELAKVIAESPKICNAVHLPVQSGSNAVLKAMNRKYTVEDYLKKVDVLRQYVPDCTLTTDLIVGFPNESDSDFEDTMRLVEKVGYSSAFTYVYSKREGTVAAKMDGQIPEEVSKARIMRLIELVNAQTRSQSALYVGKTVEILCEDFDKKKGLYQGRDEYGRMAYFASNKNDIGEFITLKIKEANGIALYGDKV